MSDAWIGLIGVIVGAVITGGKEAVESWLNRRRDAEYLAIRFVCMLDRFVEGCAAISYDDGTSQGQPAGREDVFEAQTIAPAYDVPSVEANWRSIPVSLMYDALGFPTLIEQASRRLSGVAEHAEPDNSDWITARQIEYAKLGQEAAQIAKRFRQEYNIADPQYKDWNPIAAINENLERLEEEREERRRRINTVPAFTN